MSPNYVALLNSNNKFILINVVFILLIFSVTIIFIWWLCSRNRHVRSSLLLCSLCYHTIMSLVYYFSTVPYDAIKYYVDTVTTTSSFLGAYGNDKDFIIFTLYPLVKYLKLSFLSCFMLFNIIGFFGLVLFYLTLKEEIPLENKANKYVNLALFLPGLNFWTSMLGKDAYIMFALGLILYSLANLKKRYLTLIIGLVLAAHIRPYVFMLVISCLLLTILLSSKEIGFMAKLTLAMILILLMIPGYYYFLQEVKLQSLDVKTAETYLAGKQVIMGGGGSDIDISDYNIFFKAFTFLYRPLFFDAHNIRMLVGSIENAIYLILTLTMMRVSFLKFVLKEKSILIRFSFLYLITGTFIISHITTNLGTATRIKNMLIITLLLLFLEFMAKSKESINEPQLHSKPNLSRV